MAKDDFQRRIVVQIKPPEPGLLPEIPAAPDAVKTAVTAGAELSPELAAAPDQSTAFSVSPAASLSSEVASAPDASVLAQEARALLETALADAFDTSRVQVPFPAIDLPNDLPDASNATVLAPGQPDARLSGELADSPDASVRFTPPPLPELPSEVASAPDASVLSSGLPFPELSGELSAASDATRVQTPGKGPELPNDLPDAADKAVLAPAPLAPALNADLPDSPDRTILRPALPAPELRGEVADSPDASRTVRAVPSPDLSAELTSAADTQRIQKPIAGPELKPDLVDAPSKTTVRTAPPKPELQPELPDAPSRSIVRPVPAPPAFTIESIPDPGEIGQEKSREFSFTGRWIPNGDPLNLDPKDYSILRNFRHKDDGIEGAGGFSYINSVALGMAIKSGIQLRTNYAAQRSAVLVQEVSGATKKITANETAIPNPGAFNTGAFVITGANNVINLTVYPSMFSSPVTIDAGSYSPGSALATNIQDKINATGILRPGGISWTCTYSETAKKFTITPSAGQVYYTHAGSTAGTTLGFTANQGAAASIVSDTAVANDTPLMDEDASAGLARFTHLPQGNIGMCDGVANRIWAGDEMPPAAVLITKKTVIGSTTPWTITANGVADYTEAMRNTLTDSNNIISSLGGNTYGTAGTSWDVVKNYGGTGYAKYSAGGIDFVALGCKAGDYITFSGFAGGNTGNNGTFRVGNPSVAPVATGYIVVRNSSAVDCSAQTGITASTQQNMLLIGSTRPLSSAYFKILSASTKAASSMAVYYRTGAGWAANCLTADGTVSGGITMAQSGSIAFSGTSAKPFLLAGRYLYWYLFLPSACNAQIDLITANAALQSPVDLWDGIQRTAIYAVVKRYESDVNTYYDYTLEVAEQSAQASPLGAKLGGLNWANGECLTVVLSERACALYLGMFDGKLNTAASTALTVEVWNGMAWSSVASVFDGTDLTATSKSLGQSGYVSWDYIDKEMEKETEIRGHKGYAYRLHWASALSVVSTDQATVVIDVIKGIPCSRALDAAYTFPFQYRNRAFWCGCVSDGELHRADYSMSNAPDVYNGDDSSRHDNSQSLYFGGRDALTGAAELFNQYGLNLASGALFFKNTETFLLTGSGPSDFAINKVSGQIGCPAPLTITPAEVAFTTGDQPPANIVLWMGDKGPVMYYNTSLYAIPGVEPFFETGNALCINTAQLSLAAAGYDPFYREWNLVFPSGSSTGCDTWLVYDLVRRKWWQRVTANAADFPQGFIPVEDVNGNKHLYAYTTTGYLLRLEHGLYDGSDAYGIVNTVKTADILPAQSMWLKTYLRRIKTLCLTNAGTLDITHYADGNATGTAVLASGDMNPNANRYQNLISQVYGTVAAETGPPAVPEKRYAISGLSHSFQFAISGASAVKPKLLGYGVQWLPDREDN